MRKKLTAAERQAIDERREHVAQMWALKMTVRQIAAKLENPGKDKNGNYIPPCINPKTGKPWSKSEIQRDIEFIRAELRKEYCADIMEHRIDQLAEIDALQRSTADPRVRLSCIQTKMRLLGTEAPQKLEHTGKDGGPIDIKSGPTLKEVLDELGPERAKALKNALRQALFGAPARDGLGMPG